MIHKSSLIKLIRTWPPPNLSDQTLLDSAWNDWARYETLKRYVRPIHFQLTRVNVRYF